MPGITIAAPIEFGETFCSSIGVPSETDDYTFNANAGDTVYARLTTNYWTVGQIQLNFPNGTNLGTARAAGIDDSVEIERKLPDSSPDPYSIVVSDLNGDSTGNYCLYVQRTNRPGNAETVAYGEVKTGTIPDYAQMDTYSFNANARDRIFSRLTTNWTDNGYLRLYLPNGTRLAVQHAAGGDVSQDIDQLLPLTGNYTLLVGDWFGDNTGDYSVYVQRTNRPGNAASIAYGDTKSDTLSKFAQMGNYSFKARAGDKINARLTTSWINHGQIRLYMPNGSRLAVANAAGGDTIVGINNQLLPTSGNYTLLIGDWFGDNTGNYYISLQYTGSEHVTAAFSANRTKGKSPLAVRFSDESSNSPFAWNWSFGDGNYSSEQDPVHTFTKPGLYTIRLTASNSYGPATAIKLRYINAGSISGIGVFRPSNKTFYEKIGPINRSIRFGYIPDIPITGDWNGDGLWDVGVFHSANSTFLLKTGPGSTATVFGQNRDIPITGDWNGDGLWDVGVFNKSTHRFLLKNGTRITTVIFGPEADLPVTGDWNGDGLWDVGVFNKSTHRFLLWNRTTPVTINLGLSTDLPISGDWNGDTLYDIGVYRPSNQTFYMRIGNRITQTQYGLAGDKPVTGKWR